MNPGDRLVVVFVEPEVVGDEFVTWPLHVTIVPWFRTEATTEELAAEWSTELQDIAPFKVHVDGEARFGYRGEKLVNLIKGPSPLFVIHERVRAVLKRRKAWIVDETTKVRKPFRPHVARQGTQRVYEGNTFTCRRLHIVVQNGKYKEIVGEVNLHD